MKHLIIAISLIGFLSCQNENGTASNASSNNNDGQQEVVSNSEIVSSSRKLYTTFGKFDVVNEFLPGNLSNATQKQVDLKNLIQGNSSFTLQNVLTVEQLKSIFPKKIGSLVRDSYDGETNSILGSPTTFVKADYRIGDNIARVSFTETGASPQILVGVASWAGQVINTKDDKFYQHTKTFGGHPAHERVINGTNANNFDFIVDNRWVFSIQSINIPIDQIHNLAGSFNIDKLRSLVK